MGGETLLQSRSPRKTTPIYFVLISPWVDSTPRKPSVPCRLQLFYLQILWLYGQPFVAHDMGETVYQTYPYGYMLSCGSFPIRSYGLLQTPLMVHCRNHLLSKCSLRVKYLLVPYKVITGPRNLVSYCLYRYHIIRLCHLLLIITPYICIVTDCKIRCLYIGPG